MLTEYVKERLARLLAENRPRRVQARAPTEPSAAPPGASSIEEGMPDFYPSDDYASDYASGHADAAGGELIDNEAGPPWFEPSPRRSLIDPSPSPSGQEVGLVDVAGAPPWASARTFGRAHLGVVSALLVVGLLFAGWSVLRARPVAMASTAAAVPSVGSRATASVGRSSSSPTASASPAPILVHVLGAVRKPGVVTLAARSRVRDAITAAGGLTRSAAPGELNLAQVLDDGQQVVIGTERKPSGEVRSSSSAGSSSAAQPSAGAEMVNLNSATATQLEDLPGVGPVTAGKIVAWRTEHHRFSRVEELQEVDGIGPKTYADIAPHAQV